MKEKKRFLFVIFLFSATTILLYSCASAPKVVTNYYLDPNKNSSPIIDHEGLSIEAKPITLENYKKFTRVYTSTTLTEIKSGNTYPLDGFILLDIPSFELTITNNTGHTITFSKASIKLQDDAGERYDVKMKSDIISDIDNYSAMYATRGYTLEAITLKNKLKLLRIVDRNFEILDGTTEKGYLTFNFGFIDTKAYENFLSSKNFLKLMLYEIPVKTDDAGNVTKTAKFDYIFDVSAKVDTLKQ